MNAKFNAWIAQCISHLRRCGHEAERRRTRGIGLMLILPWLLIAPPAFAQQFTAKSLGDYGNVTVMEASGSYNADNADDSINAIPRQTIAKEFFKTHKDDYDFLVIFTNFDFSMPQKEPRAFYSGVKNDTQGIGQDAFDRTEAYGSIGKLQGTVDMGNLATLVTNPQDPKFEETLGLLSHALVHRWLAYVKFKESNNSLSSALLDTRGGHWSFLLDSKGSLMHGNTWHDNGDGTFTSTSPQSEMKYFSPLDLYLMGMIDKSQVPPMLLIENSSIDRDRLPEMGVTISGTGRMITIDSIIDAMGPRAPDAASSPKSFKTAFIFITQPGTFAEQQLSAIENIRNGGVTRFSILTDGKSIMEISAVKKEDIPNNPGTAPQAATPRTLPPNLNDGASWLMAKQQSDGSWMDQNKTAERDTAEAATALKNVVSAQQNYQKSAQWLGGTVSGNLDFLSRKIDAFSGSGRDLTLLVSDIVSRQNSDGGWGSGDTFRSSAADTAMAVKALSAAGYSDQGVIAKAIAYLKTKQNPDGGWGGEDTGGMVQDTSNVLSVFNKYRAAYPLEDAITLGSAWLIARQNGDGGFGNSPSTVYDTAGALKTLRELNVPNAITNKAIGYMFTQQSPDGSWQASAYQTALALDVLLTATVFPDLSIQPENISIYPASIKTLPQNIVINADIWNLGQTGTDAKVVLYQGEVSAANKIGEQTLSFAGQSSTTISFGAMAQNSSEQRFTMVIDPDNLVTESNKLNNTAIKVIKSMPNMDLEVLPSDITLSANPADMAQDVKITTVLRNKGTTDAYNVQVKFSVDAASPYEIITKTIDVLPASSSVTSEVVWRTNRAGVDLPVTVAIDPLGEYSGFEFIRENNKASVPITVNPNGRPNLTVSYRDMVITPSPANERGAATVSVLVKNEGFSSAANVAVNVFCGVPGYDGIAAGTKIVPLIGPGEQTRVNIDWPDIPVAGERIIYVQTVYNGEEIRTDDNDAFLMLTILTLPDLTLSTNSITFSPVAPKDGDVVSIRAVVQNAGEQTAKSVLVKAYDGGSEIGSSMISAIAGNTQAAAVIPFNTAGKQGAHQITVVVDPDNAILENNRVNNRATRTLGVQNGNLWLTEPIISPNGDGIKDSTQLFFSFDTPATVSVKVVSRLGNIFRTFNDPSFANTTAGNITWDGLDDSGVLVNDGLYRFEVRDAGNRLLGTLSVQVDTNRSPITDAIGTKYLLNNNLTCNMPDITDGTWKWFPDESGIVAIVPDDPNTSEYPAGLYTVSADGVDVQRITPAAWKNINAGCEDISKLPCERYSYLEFAVSPDSANVAAVVKIEKATRFVNNNPQWTTAIQLALMDRDGRNILPVENFENAPSISIVDLKWNASGDRLVYRIQTNGTEELWSVRPDGSEKTKLDTGGIYDANNLFWSPDGNRIVYRVHTAADVEELWSMRPDGTEKLRIDSEASGYFGNFKWSPDSSRIAYTVNDMTIRVTDLSGSKKDVYAVAGWLDSFSWLGLQKIVLRDDTARIIDLTGNGSYIDLDVNGWNYSVIPSPTGSGVAVVGDYWSIIPAFATVSAQNSDWPQPFLIIFDPDGKVLYEWQDRIATAECVARAFNPVWSPDGVRIAFNEQLARGGDGWLSCNNDPYGPLIVAADIRTKKEWVASTSAFPAGLLSDGNYAQDPLIPVAWLSDGAYVLSKQEIYHVQGWNWLWLRNDYYLTDIESGETKSLSPAPEAVIEWTANFISPHNRYYTYYRQVDASSVCSNKGTKDLWSMRSLLNLTADLRIVRKKTALILRGTAADLNFEGYRLEYADVKSPDVWNPIQPPSDSMVLNEILTSWAPPYEGIFYVRLTVWDKAGNTATDRKRITWGLGAILTNVYKTRNLFSPNIKDGIQDTVEVHYRVMEPANLEFAVLDQNKTVVRTMTKSYTAPSEDFIEWDGRDNNDNPVPDGLYVITILDFELAVEVDNTVPDIGLSITDVSNVKPDEWLGSDYVPPYAELFAHATDKNIKEWVIEYGEGENPQEWHEYMRGGADLPQQFEGDPPSERPIKEYSGADLEWLAGKKIRIRALDTAGNVSTTIRNLKEELFAYKYQAKGQLTDLSLCDTCDCLLHAPLAYPGKYPFTVLETFFRAIVGMNMQYKVNGQWMDTPATAGPASAYFSIDWINRYTGQNITAIRIKALDDMGQALYSNEICVEKPAPVVIGDGGGGSGGGGSGGGGGDGGGGVGSAIGLTIGYPGQTCGLVSRPVGTVSLLGLMSTGAMQLYSGGLYITDPNGVQHLQQLDIIDNGPGNSPAKWSVKPAVIDTSGLAEGTYLVNAAVAYQDLGSGVTGTVASGTQKLVVDKTMPVVQLYVTPCTERKKDIGGEWRGLLIQGVADDNVAVRQYDLLYGLGDNPTQWIPVMNRWIEQIDQKQYLRIDAISGKKANKAILGTWDVTALIGKKITLKLMVEDTGGNLNCIIRSFTIKEPITLSGILTAPQLFSPNDDGIIDTTTVQYQVNQDGVIDVKAYKLVEQKDKTFALDTVPVKEVLSGFQYIRSVMGIDRVLWDGTNDAFTAVSDELYGLDIVATDQCGYTVSGWDKVEVDNTKPTVTITYPKPADPLYSTIISVAGIADDLHFSNYLLEAGEGEAPIVWKKVLAGTSPVKDGFLGEWNSYGKLGTWSFRLTATDTVGNQGVTTTVVDLGNRQNLIRDLSLLPRIFSPNNDNRLDTTTVTYEVADAANIVIEILDSNNAVRKTSSTSVPSLGVYNAIWDGKDNTGVVVPDGVYTLKLTAMLASNPTTSQAESVTVVVDDTAPSIVIEQPQGNAYLAAETVPVTGSILDPNIVGYSITFGDGSFSTLLDHANQSREKYSFGQMNSLAEGSYALTIVANDLGQNETKQIIPFTIDRTPPAVKLDTPKKDEYYGGTGGAGGNQSFAVVNVTGGIVEKNLESFNLRYGSGDSPTSWTDLVSGKTLTAYPSPYAWKVGKTDGIDDGTYTLSLYAKDKAGQTGEARVTIKIDNTLPTVAITSHHEGDYVKQPVDVKGTATDLNFEKYMLEFSEGQCASAFKWAEIKTGTAPVQDNILGKWQALPADGDYCLRITATDKVSQTAEAKVHVKVDTHPPAAPQLSGKADNKINANLNWPANTEPDLAGYNLYRKGEKVNTELIISLTYLDQNLAEGVYFYTLKAQDFAGWESPASNEVTVKIDLSGPDAYIRSPKDGDRIGNLIDIKGTAYSSDDFKQYRVSVGQGATPSAWALLRTSPVSIPYGILTQWDTINLAENETYAIKLEAEDISGNITTHQIRVVIDNTPPAAPVLISAGALVSDVTTTWRANAESDLAGYLLFRNDQLVNVPGVAIGNLKPYLLSTATTTYLDKALPDGVFRYYLMAMDEAGNMSEMSSTLTVTIDTHPPHAAVIDPLDLARIGQKFMVRAESPDLDIASVQFQYQSTSSSPTTTTDWLNLGSPVTSSTMMTNMDPAALGLAYGDYRLRALAKDLALNTDPTPSFLTIIYADLTPPAAPTGLSAHVSGGTVTLTWTANTESDFDGYNVYRTAGGIRTQITATVVKAPLQPTYPDIGLADGLYTYDVTAVDTNGNESKPSSQATAKVYAPVITQPYTPVGQNGIQIMGSNAAADSRADILAETASGYALMGTATVNSSGTFTAEIPLSLGENRLTARTTDSAGNVSKNAAVVVVVYNDTPGAPTGLSATAQNSDAHLTWNQNPETDLLGYNLFRNGVKVNVSDAAVPATITSSTSFDPYSYDPWLAIDADPATFWMPQDGTNTASPAWWEMDLAAPELVSRVSISWGHDFDTVGNEVLYAGKDFEVQVWSVDANAWITQATVIGNAVKDNIFYFNPAYLTDKIRIFITDSTDANSSKQVRLVEVGMVKDNLITFATTSTPSYDDLNLVNKQYGYTVTAVDTYGFESRPTGTVNGDVSVAPPSAPVLAASALNSDVTMTWTASPEPSTTGYALYKNTIQGWVKIGSTLVPETAFVDAGLMNGMYSYRVTASDAVGNESQPSNTATVTVAVAPPVQPNLVVTPTPEGGLRASWTYSGNPATGYNLYRSTTSGGMYTKAAVSLITDTSYLDTGLMSGVTYYYVVAAVDLVGNEGGYSNEASGMSLDTVAPSKPVILMPTTSSTPITLLTGRTNVSGIAEPGAAIDLFNNSEFVGSAVVQAADEIQSYALYGNDDYGASISPDGNKLVYTVYEQGHDAIWLKSLDTGSEQSILSGGYEPLWSPDGKRIAYFFWQNGNRIGIYDVATGGSGPLTDDSLAVYTYQNSPSWSADGTKLTFIKHSGATPGIWRKDFTTDALDQLVGSAEVSNQKLSPDGTKMAHTDNNGGLYLYDLAAGSTVLVDDNTDGYSLEWSPDGRKLAFVSYRNGSGELCILSMETGDQTIISGSSGDPYYLAWTGDGQNVLFDLWDEANDQDTIWLADVQGRTQTKRIMPELKYVYFVGASRSGIAIMEQTADGAYRLHMMRSAGRFEFTSVQLNPGENIFTAISSDTAGNTSPASDAVSVTYDVSTTPDIVVSAEEVYLYPPYPVAGEQMTINAVVSNPSLTDISNVDVVVYVWNALNQLELLKSETIPVLAAGSSALVTATWNSTGKIGDNRFVMVVDPEDRIAESDETNNMAIKDFFVADHVGMSMSTVLDAAQYPSARNANISVTIWNSGPAANTVLSVQIEDANGYPVYTFDQMTVSAAYASEVVRDLVWNTGSTYAGSYAIHAILKEVSGAILAENNTPFTIVSDAVADLTVTTDKIGYNPKENVITSFKIKNTGTNTIIPTLQATISISNAAGVVLFSEVKTASNLLPGSSVDLSSLWNTGLNLPGDYQVTVSVSFDGGAIVTKSAGFKINTILLLTGTITSAPPVVPVGNTAQVSYTLTNVGNADALGYTVRITILDPETQTVKQTSDEVVDITANASRNGQITINTSAYELKTYVAVLQTLAQGATKNIANTTFAVKDLTPPVIGIITPTANGVYNSTVGISVSANDNASGVDSVEYRRDSGQWQILPVADPAQGRYGATWDTLPADNGSHIISFRATDKAGNTSVPVLVNIVIQSQTDTTPPTGSIAINNGATYTNNALVTLTLGCTDAESGCSQMQFSSDNATWTAQEAYGSTRAWQVSAGDGLKTLYVKYTDSANNTSLAYSASSTLDTTPPVLTLSTLPNGAITNNDTLNIAGTATDNIGLQSIMISNATVTVNADGTFSQVVSLITGSNTITTIATDLAGNTTTDTRTITLDQTAPQITITHPADNSITNVADTTVTGAVDKIADVIIRFKDGPVLGEVRTGSTFTFPITLQYGQNTIEVSATDLATNSSTAKRTVTLDNLSPALAVTYPAQDITTNQASILLQGTVADLTIATVTIAHEGNTYTPAVTNGTFEQQLTFSDEKTYAIVVTATDAAGNTSTVQRNVIFDKTPPVLTIDPVKTPTNNPQQLITGTKEINSTVTATCAMAIVGEVSYPTDTTWQVVLANMTEGTNQFSVTAADQIGNVSNPVTVTIILDTKAPDTIIQTGPAPLTNQNGASFGFISTEEGSTFECSLDQGNFAPCTNPATYNGLAENVHTFQVRATDLAGNTDQTPAVYIWTIDTVPPIAVIMGVPPSLTNARGASLTITGNDVIAYQYSLDFGVFSAETSASTPILLSGLLDGAHTVSVAGKDSAGNWQRYDFATRATWTVDITPPALNVSTLPDGSITNNDTLNIAGTASDANGILSVVVSSQTITIDTSDNVNYTFSQAISLATGSNTLTTVATDKAGNPTSDTRTIFLDRNAPVITITNPADNSLTNKAAVDVTGFVDKTATMSIKVNGISPLPDVVTSSTFTFPVTLAYDGNLIEVTAVDLANNKGTAKRSVKLDNLSPALAITNPNQDMGTNLSVILIGGTVSDLTDVSLLVTCPTASIGVVSRPTSTTWSVDIANMQQGTNAVTVQATDLAGNSTSVIRNIISSPTPVAIDPVRTPTNNSQQQITGTMELASTVTATCATAIVGDVSYPTPTTWQVIIAGMTEGANIIHVTATDLEGRLSNPVTATIVLDTHAPITTPSPEPGAYYNTVTATLAVDEPATIYYTIDGTTPTASSAVYNRPLELTATTTLNFFAVDMATNVEAIKSATYTVVPDITPPVTTITAGSPNFTSGGGQLYVTSLSLFTLSATDNLSGVKTSGYRFDNGTWNTYASPFSLVTEGSHTIGYRSTDNAANVELEKNLGIVVDNTSPVSTITIGAPPVTVSTAILITAIDSASGVRLIEYNIDGNSWTTYTGSFTLATYSQGTHTINYRSTDNVMNVEIPKSQTVQLWTERPMITTTALADGTVSAPYNQTLAATGGTSPYMWSLPTGTLPTGLLLNNTTGAITGTPTSAGTSTITFQVADTHGMTDTKVLVITIYSPPYITTSTLAFGTTGTAYSQTLSATGGKLSYVWSISPSTLPAGLSLNSSTGVISGTPTSTGTSTFTVQVQDANNATSTKPLSITIYAPLTISTASLPTGTTGIAYSQTLAATGGLQPYVWSTIIGTLPAGLSLSSSTGVISGTPTSAGTSTFTAQVKDANNSTSSKVLAITSNSVLSIPQNLGVFGATGVTMSGGYVDSYDSTQGAYNGVHGSNVSVGTNSTANGAITLSGGVVDYGDMYVGPGGDPARVIITSGGAVIDGTKGALSQLKNMTPMSDPGGGTPVSITNGTTLTSGTYRVSSVNLSGSGKATINGSVTLYVTGSINLSGSSQIVILPGSSLTIYLKGSLNVSGGSLVNQTLSPHNLTIYGTSTCTSAGYSGSSALYGVIYTPAASTAISGGVNVYGSVIGKSVNISGGSAVHYDASLGNIGP